MTDRVNSVSLDHARVSPWSALRTRLLALIILVLFPAFLLLLYTASEQGRLASIAAQQEALRLAQLAASNQDQLIVGAEQLLTALSLLPVMQGDNSTACNELFVRLREQYNSYTNLWVSRANGDTYCSGIPTPSTVNVSNVPWFKRAMQTHGFSVSDYGIGVVSKKPVITFSYPVYDDNGQIKLQVGTSLDLEWMNGFLQRTQLPPDTAITAIDRNGIILYRYPNGEAWVGKPYPNRELVQQLVTEGTGIAQARGVDDIERLYGFSPLGKTNGSAYVLVGTSRDIAFAGANQLLLQNLFGLGAVGLLSLLVAWYGVNRFFVQPVQLLLNTTKRLTSGDLRARVNLRSFRSSNELTELSQAFNEMAGSLEQRQRELALSNTELAAEIAERKRIEADLQTALEQAQSADRAKTALLATVSHEMRTPLSSIIGFSNLILGRPLEQDKLTQYVSFINSEARRLATLINDFLDLQRLEAGRAVFHYTPVDLAELVQEVAKQPQPDVNWLYKLKLDLPPVPSVFADKERIRQVLSNLLSNALKYATDGTIALALRTQGNQVIFSVSDEGYGIPAEELGHIFDRFYRGQTAEHLRIRGTGLGLALCREIIQGHGGQIWAESAGPNLGSTFSFALPLPGNPLAEQTPPTHIKQSDADKGLIVIIDDDANFVAYLTERLRLEGYTIQRLNHEQATPDQLAQIKPQLTIMDVLKGEDQPGWSLLMKLKEDIVTRSIPVIVCSFLNDPVRVERFGASAFVVKPVDEAYLLKAIARLNERNDVRAG
ncbi:MAG: response regulator [Anaerolineae bacterium]|nr:response regulator [Anaerolineae bacterium]